MSWGLLSGYSTGMKRMRNVVILLAMFALAGIGHARAEEEAPAAPEKAPAERPEVPAAVHASVITSRKEFPTTEEIQGLAGDGAKVEKKVEKDISTWSVTFPDGAALEINVGTDLNLEVQRKGMAGWVNELGRREPKTPQIEELKKAVPTFELFYGILLPGGFDRKGTITRFLEGLAEEVDGYLMSGQTIYDAEGFRVIGGAGGQPVFGAPGRHKLLLEGDRELKEVITGTWDSGFGINQREVGTLTSIGVKTVDTYAADGSFRRTGVVEIKVHFKEGGEATGKVDIECDGTWSVDDRLLSVDSGPIRTSNAEATREDLGDLLGKFVKTLETENEGISHHVIARDPDKLFLQYEGVPLFLEMRRKNAEDGE